MARRAQGQGQDDETSLQMPPFLHVDYAMPSSVFKSPLVKQARRSNENLTDFNIHSRSRSQCLSLGEQHDKFELNFGMANHGTAVPVCGYCSKMSAVCRCRECETAFCKTCCSLLHTQGVLGGHIVEEMGSLQSRLCRLHDWEKLTVYSLKSKSFGCIRCFQEGPLKGHHGLSLQVSI